MSSGHVRASSEERKQLDTTAEQLDCSIAVLGYLGDQRGVGQSGRLWLSVLERIGRDTIACDLGVPWSKTGSQRSFVEQNVPVRPVDFRILCFNADETRLMLHHPVVRRVTARHTIGVWHWETRTLPLRMRGAASGLDEILGR